MGQCAVLLAILVILVILLIIYPQLSDYVRKKVGYSPSAGGSVSASAPAMIPDTSAAPVAPVSPAVAGAATGTATGAGTGTKEHMVGSPTDVQLPSQTSDMLLAMGYTGTVPWDEVIQATELDPSTFSSQQEFVKDVRRFSSGANFTSVTDDNTNLAFTNFIGLQRPQHVPIGSTARQVPDIDENVLQRNHQLRFN